MFLSELKFDYLLLAEKQNQLKLHSVRETKLYAVISHSVSHAEWDMMSQEADYFFYLNKLEIYIMYHKIFPFPVYNSVTLLSGTPLAYLALEHFHHPPIRFLRPIYI